MEIQSVKKAMRLLFLLAEGKNQPATLSALSALSGYPKPTCSHLLSTLEQGAM